MAITPTKRCGEGFKRMSTNLLTPKIKGDNHNVKARRSLLNVSETDHQYCLTKSDFDPTLKSNSSKSTSILKSHLENIGLNSEPDSVIADIVDAIFKNKVLVKAVQRKILADVNDSCTILSSKNIAFGSVLAKYRDVEKLIQQGDLFFSEAIHELSERVPFVLDLMTTIATGEKEPAPNKVMPIVAAYATLMKARNENISAWHRLTTFVEIKGQLDDVALGRLNHLRVTMCAKTQLRLLDEAGKNLEDNIGRQLVINPLVKVTGDNLDIYVRTGHKSLEKSNKDLHMFESNINFSRVAKPGLYSLTAPKTPLDTLKH